MLEREIHVGNKYVWGSGNPKAYKVVTVIDIRKGSLMKELDITETDENLTWIGFEDENENKAWVQEATFREDCIEINQYPDANEPIVLKPPPLTFSSPATITLTIEIPAELEEEFTELLKETLGEKYNVTKELRSYYYIKKRDSDY